MEASETYAARTPTPGKPIKKSSIRGMNQSTRSKSTVQLIRLGLPVAALALLFGCGYRFAGAPTDNPYPPDLKTVVLESAVNNTIVTGIETELTNELRQEFALGTGLTPVRSGGDAILKTVISSYVDTPSTYKADGKELTRIGVLRIECSLQRADSNKVLWQKELSSSYPYNVTDTISETLSNRRRAISKMIKDVTPRLHRSMYDNF
ncbi:MAG: LPS assembly lipoprotein LptE [Desulfomonilaceae bacterium]